MRKIHQAAAALAAVLIALSACDGPSREVGESSLQEVSPGAESPSGEIPDWVPEAEPAGSPVPALPTLPADYDPSLAYSVLDYFLFLLESGGEGAQAEPFTPATELEHSALNTLETYRESLFAGLPVPVVGFQPQGSLSAVLDENQAPLYEGKRYLLTLNVPEECGELLRPGKQEWMLDIDVVEGAPPRLHRLMHRSRFDAMQEVQAQWDESLTRILSMRAISYDGLFDSPADIPPESRTAYLLTTVEPGGTWEDGGSYLSQEDMDAWSRRLWGVSPYADPGSQFYGPYDNGRNVYTLWIGWGPPSAHPAFIEVSGDGRCRYAVYGPADTLLSSPEQVVEYTLRDGLVWSCKDVSDQAGTGPYRTLAE